MPQVTLQTLADDLGVSRSTVSNAFGRPDQLSAGLRERILTRAEELRFSGPDPVARGLRRGRVGAVGVLVDQGLSYAAAELGVPVPHRLSVTGFDDIASAATTEPALTTVAQQLRQRGELAGALIRLLLDGRPAPEPPRLPVELVVRASTGPVPPSTGLGCR
ncbi:MAG: putative LacI-family transcriptional regulator [Nocardioidaceae bacterium]|nr:putative LacI-family transcriptional regulator [Nocardioidaceae bacterium]